MLINNINRVVSLVDFGESDPIRVSKKIPVPFYSFCTAARIGGRFFDACQSEKGSWKFFKNDWNSRFIKSFLKFAFLNISNENWTIACSDFVTFFENSNNVILQYDKIRFWHVDFFTSDH